MEGYGEVLFPDSVVSVNDCSHALDKVEQDDHPEDGRDGAAEERAEVAFTLVIEYGVMLAKGTSENASSAAQDALD